MQTFRFDSFMLMGLCFLASCDTTQTFTNMTDSRFATTRDTQGRSVLADTPQSWALFKRLTDLSVEREKAGDTHFGGRTPNDATLNAIRHLKTDQEHPQKYINYIIEKRRAAGLPELVGYPP